VSELCMAQKATVTSVAELPWEPPFEMPDYKEVGRMLMSFGRIARDDEPMIGPSFENDPEYEKMILDGCTPPEPLCPFTGESAWRKHWFPD
jgi:hypothetical protein